jgi:hypothetical protein
MRAMMQEVTRFIYQWRFTVSRKKTQIVSCGAGETRTVRDRIWSLGNEIIEDVSSYKYLGLHSEKQGLWKKMLDTNVDKSNNAYRQLYQLGYGDSCLQVGESAALWQLFARPRLFYGAEIWSFSTKKQLKKIESAQVQAARRVFGKQSNASVIVEALLGDLGWLSARSCIAEMKLNFFGSICRLDDNRLIKKVFFLVLRTSSQIA